jgi:hypothetical protein
MVKENSTAGQTTNENVLHAHCVIDIKGYKHTFTNCYLCYFSTATVFALNALILRYTYIASLGQWMVMF